MATRGESADANERLGEALLALGRDSEGLAHWERVAEIDPDRFDVRWRAAGAHYNRGEYAAAMQAARKAVETQWTLAERSGLDGLGLRFLGLQWTGMIGHLALLDVYAKLAMLDGIPLEQRILLVEPSRVSNPHYLRYWRSLFPAVIDDADGIRTVAGLARQLEEHFTMFRLPDGRFRTLHQTATEVEARWRAEGRGPLLQLVEQDEERGVRALERLGIPRDAWFVGLHVREGGPPWRDIHNADIESYADAAQAIVERGGWVVRMGNPGMRPAPALAGLVDYAHSAERSDWMDVFLWARCRFFVGTASGPVGVPPTFGVPCVHTNWAPLAFRHWFDGDLVVPKLYWSDRESRLLHFGETLSSAAGRATDTKRLRSEHGIVPLDNAPEEIAEVVVEMIERLEGTAPYSAEDEVLRHRFESLHPDGEFAYRAASRVGREWLRRHQDLLGA